MASEHNATALAATGTAPEKVEIFDVPKRKTVKVAASPATLSDYKEIPVEEFCAREGFQWTDSVLANRTKKTHFERNKNSTLVKETLIISILLNTVEGIISQNIPVEDPQYPPNRTQLMSILLSHFRTTQKEILSGIDTNIAHYEEEVKNLLKKSDRPLIICQMDTRVGKGVFLSPQARPIKKHDIVAFYAGEYETSVSADGYSPYGCETIPHPIYSEDNSNTTVAKGKINAMQCGNESRYFQDLPTEAELKEEYDFPPDLVKNIATANLELGLVFYHHYPFVFFKAVRDIQPGEQLGFSYSAKFWARASYYKNSKRCLFNKNDWTIIDDTSYVNYLYLRVTTATSTTYYTFSIQRIISIVLSEAAISFKAVGITLHYISMSSKEFRDICKQSMANSNITLNQYFQLLIDVIGATEKRQQTDIAYTNKFIFSVMHTLLKHLSEVFFHHSGESQQKVSYISKLREAIEANSKSDADAVFLALKHTLNDTSCIDFYKKQLPTLRTELIKLMQQYNADKQKAIAQSDHHLATATMRK